MTASAITLGVNIDHVATLREARRARYPDPVHAALAAEMAGADSITLHLREDRRHIRDHDVHALRGLLQTRMNLEMAVTDEMIEIARDVRPSDSCLVPERRQEITTEGGLDAAAQVPRLVEAVAALAESGIRAALFIDPEVRQVEAAARVGAPAVELHTGAYAEATGAQRALELERLRAEKTAAEEIARHKDRVLSLVSHELGNPLAALRTFVELAREQKGEAAPAIEKVLGRMDAQVERMARLVADLYDLRSAEHGQLRVEKRTCDLAAVVGEAIERFRAISPGVRLEVEAPEALWGAWDPVRLDQLVSNLLGNAVKYAGEAGPIVISLRPASGSSVHLTVSDRGPGIAPEKLPLIFEPFQRADSGERRRGLGIGLALARQIALGHGGAIWAESRPGEGACFHVRLPTGGVVSPS